LVIIVWAAPKFAKHFGDSFELWEALFFMSLECLIAKVGDSLLCNLEPINFIIWRFFGIELLSFPWDDFVSDDKGQIS
jgi:hypothetical protein